MQVAPALAAPGTPSGSDTAPSESAPMGSTAAGSKRQSESSLEQTSKAHSINKLGEEKKYKLYVVQICIIMKALFIMMWAKAV